MVYFTITSYHRTNKPKLDLENQIMTKAVRAKCIMVLDDEHDAVTTFERVLRLNGYHVLGFTNSCEAFEHLRQHPTQFDLVISDIRMPFMDGIEFAKRVKEQLPALHIVLVTAFEIDNLESEDMESLGVREIARKPMSMPQLLAIVAKHVTREERLDTLYLCQDCKSVFLFKSDVSDHEDIFGHKKYSGKLFHQV